MALLVWLLAASAGVSVASPSPAWLVSTSNQTRGVGDVTCSPCLQIGEQGISLLLNYILNAGVVGSCGELCSHAGSGPAQTACELACAFVGIKEFVKLIEKVDLDPFYLCEEIHACKAGPDNASATVVGAQAQPASVKKGDEVEMVLEVNVAQATGVGEFRLRVHGPVTAQISQGFPLVDGLKVGDQNLGVKLQIKDDESGDQPVVWNPGTYTFEFTVCQGECGSKHPHSKVFGNATGTFELTEAKQYHNTSIPRETNLGELDTCGNPGDCGRAYQGCCAGFAAKGFPCGCHLTDGSGKVGTGCGDCGTAYQVCCAGFKAKGFPCTCDVGPSMVV